MIHGSALIQMDGHLRLQKQYFKFRFNLFKKIEKYHSI